MAHPPTWNVCTVTVNKRPTSMLSTNTFTPQWPRLSYDHPEHPPSFGILQRMITTIRKSYRAFAMNYSSWWFVKWSTHTVQYKKANKILPWLNWSHNAWFSQAVYITTMIISFRTNFMIFSRFWEIKLKCKIHNTPWKFINISILHLIAVPLFTLIELYWLF